MRKKMFLTAMMAFLAVAVFSQITTGKVSYDVYLSSDNPQMSAYIEQMESSLMEIFFDGGKTRNDFFMGEMSTTHTISIQGEDTTLVLMDNMYLGKVALKVTENEEDESGEYSFKVKSVELIDGETKEVAGYQCKKAVVTYDNDFSTEVWYTEEIKPEHRVGQYLFEEIPGMPLEMTGKNFGMDMKIVAYEVSNKLSKRQINSLFSLEIPKGYTLKTVEELRQFGQN